ncbi:PH domain-containing protein [Staphylococcus edaphicus]|nr:PH domain-containing protein [Staphylococcus edaphicus]
MTNSYHYAQIHPSWLLMQTANIIVRCVIYMFALSFLQRLFQFTDTTKYLLLIFIALLLIINSLLYWKNFRLFFNQEKLTIREGGLLKKERQINFGNIEGFNEKTNILERLFKLSSLTLKVEANSNEKKIVLPFIKKREIAEIKNSISSTKDPTNSVINNYVYIMNYHQILKGSFASLNLILFFTFMYTIYKNISDFLNVSDFVHQLQDLYFENWTNIFMGSLIIILLTFLFGVLKNMLLFGNFKLSNHSKHIDTVWGYISNYHNSVDKAGISAINIKSSFWQKLFNINQINVININSNNKDIETNIIFPFIETDKINNHLNLLFNLDLYNIHFYKLKRSAIFVKLLRTCWSWSVLLPVVLYFFKNYSLIIYLLILLIISSQILQTFFNKYSYSSDLLVFKNSGLSLSQYIVNLQDIEDLIFSQSFLQRKFNLCSVTVVIKDNPPRKIKMTDIYDLHAQELIKYFKQQY